MVEWIIETVPIGYEDAVRTMEQRVAAIGEGSAEELVWLLEHPPLYTAGTSAKETDLLDGRFPVHKTGRGGQYTYHGPGQRVAYIMLDLRKRQKRPDVKKYVYDLEEWIIQALAEFGVKGERREGRIGIWVEANGQDKKIAAIGVRIRHWVTYHGIAINVNPDLAHFNGIVPCGIAEHGVTSLHDLGLNIDMVKLDKVLQSTFKKIF